MNKVLITLSIVFSLSSLAGGSEYIDSFHSDITILNDSKVKVKETIKVNVLGKKIKRGIFRDIPIKRYNDERKLSYVGLKILTVLRNGRVEKFTTKTIKNGIRVRIGRKNHFLRRGFHTFEITYLTNRQLRDQDNGNTELFWNITGHGWDFPIKKSSARFFLETQNPDSLSFFTAYTGYAGEKKKDFNILVESGEVRVETNVELASRQGWSVAVQFPSSEVIMPSTFDSYIEMVRLNGGLDDILWALVSLFLCFSIWYIHGIDPDKKTIVPLFSAPEDLSPGVVNYSYLHKHHNDAITASLINMAVKGAVEIDQEGSTIKILPSKDSEKYYEQLSPEEKILFNNLCSSSSGTTLSRSNRFVLKNCKKEFEKSLESQTKGLFTKNISYSVLTALCAIFSFYMSLRNESAESLVSIIGLIEYIFIGILIGRIFHTRQTDSRFKIIFSSIAIIVFLSVHGFMFGVIPRGASLFNAISLLLTAIPAGVLISLMPSPTKRGQRLIEKLEGFRMYLSMAEKHRLDKLNPPELSPEVFEEFLPFAHALGEEVSWSENFDKFVKASFKNDPNRRHYHPHWYHTNSRSLNISSLGSTIGSTINSSLSTSTSSSSSSSSGGGGGGGGGGGW